MSIQAALWPGRILGRMRTRVHVYVERDGAWDARCGDPWRRGLPRAALVPVSGRKGLCRACGGAR